MFTNAGFLVGSLASGVLLAATSFETVIARPRRGLRRVARPRSLRVERYSPPRADPEARPVGELAEGWATIRRDLEIALLVDWAR